VGSGANGRALGLELIVFEAGESLVAQGLGLGHQRDSSVCVAAGAHLYALCMFFLNDQYSMTEILFSSFHVIGFSGSQLHFCTKI
jgi:hypothetical protein